MLSGLLKKIAPTHAAKPYRMAHDAKFHMFEARRGRGKSYSLTQWAFAAALVGVPIRANFTINYYWMSLELCKAGKFKSLVSAFEWCVNNIVRIQTWDDLLLSYDCVVLLDEVNRLYDAKATRDNAAPKVAFEWLQQSRKMLVTVVFAAQGFDWLDVRIRQLADVLWRAKKEMHPKYDDKILNFWNYGSDPFQNGLNAQIVRDADFKMKVPFSIAKARLYNTHEIIKALNDTPKFATMKQYQQFLIEMGVFEVISRSYTIDTIPLEQDAEFLVPGQNYSLRGRLSKLSFDNPETIKTAFEFDQISVRDRLEAQASVELQQSKQLHPHFQIVLDWV
jgi:Zonular occludens toxin (Zot)